MKETCTLHINPDSQKQMLNNKADRATLALINSENSNLELKCKVQNIQNDKNHINKTIQTPEGKTQNNLF